MAICTLSWYSVSATVRCVKKIAIVNTLDTHCPQKNKILPFSSLYGTIPPMARHEAPTFIAHGEAEVDGAIDALLAAQPDLLIEGGSNRNPILYNFLKPHYQGQYIGMDLRDDEPYPASGFTRYGNCLRPEHVQPIIEEHGVSRVGLVTWNALLALLGNNISPDQHKREEDRLDLDTMVANITALYSVQLHLGLNAFFSTLRPFYEACAAAGWRVTDYGWNNIFVLTR